MSTTYITLGRIKEIRLVERNKVSYVTIKVNLMTKEGDFADTIKIGLFMCTLLFDT